MTLTSDDISTLIATFVESSLDELHLVGRGADLHLRRSGIGVAASAAPLPGHATITAPGVGTFLSCHPLRTEPLVMPGCRVRAGDVVALLRAGVVLRQVVAPAEGIIGATIAEECVAVGFGAALFAFHPDPPEVQP